MSKAKPRSRPDWELIENEYRIGQLTVRQMADKHGVNKTTITDRAKKHGWTRDLSEAVRVATKAALVLSETDKHGQNTDKAIATAADLNRQIIEAHRTDMADQRALMAELRAELRKAQAINALTDNVVDATKLALALGLSTAETGVLSQAAARQLQPAIARDDDQGAGRDRSQDGHDRAAGVQPRREGRQSPGGPSNPRQDGPARAAATPAAVR